MDVANDEVRRLGYLLVDRVVERLKDPASYPIYPQTNSADDLELSIGGDLPHLASSPDAVLSHLINVLDKSSANFLHPGIMTWVASTPLVVSALIDGYLSALKVFPHSWRLTPASTQIELVTARWLAEFVGFSSNGFGYFTTGGTMANLSGLAAALVAKSDSNIRERGLPGGPQPTVYCSEHAHICIEQGVSLLGIGSANLRRIAVDNQYRMQVDALDIAITRDIAAGMRPTCIVATAGTTLTGAIDPLAQIGQIAQKYNLWFHIDGSYGAFAAACPEFASLFEGMREADSLTLDPHKWMNIPFEAGCILVRSRKSLSDVFQSGASYLEGGDTNDGNDHWHYGFELSRADRATKVWFALRQFGSEAFIGLFRRHIGFAHRLYDVLLDDPDFAPAFRPHLSVVCFRFCPDHISIDVADEVNRQLESATADLGHAFVAGCILDGKPHLRMCFVNHRSRWHDIEHTIASVRSAAYNILARTINSLHSGGC